MKPRIIFILAVTACSSSAPSDDAGADAPSDSVSEASPASCDIQTCHGTVNVPAGGTTPYGDSCGTVCTCTVSGGFANGTCKWSSSCQCLDAGSD